MAVFRLVTGAKSAIFDQYLAMASITAGPSHVVNISTVEIGYSNCASSASCDQQTPPFHASVNRVYDKTLQRYAVENRNIIVRIGKSETEV